MSLSRLPNELLVNVVGRLDPSSVKNVSQVDRRFNALVKRHKLFKPVVDSIRVIEVCNFEYSTLEFTLSLGKEVREVRQCLNRADHLEKQEKQVVHFLKKLLITGTRSLDIHLGPQEFNMIELMQTAGLDMSCLLRCATTATTDTKFVKDELLERLNLKDLIEEPVFLENCITSVSFERFLQIVDKLKDVYLDKMWKFGIFDMSEDDENMLVDYLEEHRGLVHRYWKCPRTRRITHKIAKNTQGGFLAI